MPVELSLHTSPEAPLEAECIAPQHLAGLSEHGIENLEVMHGNRKARVGDFFKVSGSGSEEIHLIGNLSQVKLIGAQMRSGKLLIEGDIGMHLGCGMGGGEIVVNGNAGD